LEAGDEVADDFHGAVDLFDVRGAFEQGRSRVQIGRDALLSVGRGRRSHAHREQESNLLVGPDPVGLLERHERRVVGDERTVHERPAAALEP